MSQNILDIDEVQSDSTEELLNKLSSSKRDLTQMKQDYVLKNMVSMRFLKKVSIIC